MHTVSGESRQPAVLEGNQSDRLFVNANRWPAKSASTAYLRCYRFYLFAEEGTQQT